MINKPMVLSIQDIENTVLVFRVYSHPSTKNEEVQTLGTTTALLRGLRGSLALMHESTVRHHTHRPKRHDGLHWLHDFHPSPDNSIRFESFSTQSLTWFLENQKILIQLLDTEALALIRRHAICFKLGEYTPILPYSN